MSDTIIKKFQAIGGPTIIFRSETWAGIVYQMEKAIKNKESKFCNADAAAMIETGMMEKLEEEKDETAIKIAKDIIAKTK